MQVISRLYWMELMDKIKLVLLGYLGLFKQKKLGVLDFLFLAFTRGYPPFKVISSCFLWQDWLTWPSVDRRGKVQSLIKTLMDLRPRWTVSLVISGPTACSLALTQRTSQVPGQYLSKKNSHLVSKGVDQNWQLRWACTCTRKRILCSYPLRPALIWFCAACFWRLILVHTDILFPRWAVEFEEEQKIVTVLIVNRNVLRRYF